MDGKQTTYAEICPHDDCTGCMACRNACSHSAIVVTEDSLGFRYTQINPDVCTGCGLCSKVCPVLHPVEKAFPKECFALADNSAPELESVASGGAASALSGFVVAGGGVVYGCSGENIRDCRHIRIDTVDGVERLKGSKYVQSDIGLLFRNVREDLRAGRRVLFIGTPCQAGGLKSFLLRDYDTLVTADLVCHGVPSQKLLNENIDLYRCRYPDLVEKSVRFRHKADFATPSAAIKYGFVFRPSPDAEEIRKPWYDDPFMLGFLGTATLRLSCYTCPYAYNVRASDLTLSDFWGIGADAGFNSGDGVSSVLVNTARGAALWEQFVNARPDCTVKSRRVQESISGNMQLMCPTPMTHTVSLFRRAYPSMGLRKAVFTVLKRKRLKSRLKKILSPILSLIR